MKLITNILLVFLVSTTATIGQVSITAATGGTNIIRSTAANGSAPAYTTLGNIVILETLVNDIKQSQTDNTLILTAPSNWQFNPSVGTVNTSLGDDITVISIAVSASIITITLTTANGNVGMNSIDEITISGIQVQPLDGNITPAAGDILRTSANTSKANIDGITDYITIFGSLSTDQDTPMPVELISFSADLSGSTIYLSWSTATEVNNYGFEVQRLVEDDNWEVLGFVEGHGNSNSYKNYEFIDDLSSLTEYSQIDSLEYRLKQIDLDGSFEYYSTTAMVELRNITAIDDEVLPAKFELSQNYPNPFNPSTTIQYSISVVDALSSVEGLHQNSTGLQQVTLKVYDILAREVATLVDEQKRPGIYDVTWNAANFPSGIYILQMQAGEYSGLRKMMLVK